MATQAALACSNNALRKLGTLGTVTAVDGSDTTKEGLAVVAHLDECKKALLRMSPWNFGIKRKIITPPASFAISNVTYVSSQIVEVTHATASYVTGQYVTIAGVAGATGANGTFEIQSAVGATTTRITAPLVTSSDILGTYVAGDSDTIRLSPAFEFTYLYSLPIDLLKLISINEEAASDDWRKEGSYILSNLDTSMNIRYVFDVSDYATMDPLFYECLSTFLAWTICDHITGDSQKKRDLFTDLYGGDGKAGMLPKARFEDSVEDSMQTVQANDWVLSRGGSGGAEFEPVVANQVAV